MEIDPQVFKNILEKGTLKNKLPQIKVIFQPDGILLRHTNPTNVAVIKMEANKSAFHKYEEGKELDIRDTSKFDKLLKSFKDKINISTDDTFINIASKTKTASFKLASEIDNVMTEDSKTNWDAGFELPYTFIKEVQEDIGNIGAEHLTLEVKSKKLMIDIPGQEDKIKHEIDVDYKDCKFTIAQTYFKDIFNAMNSEKINLSFQNLDMLKKAPPLRIMEKGKVHKLTVWIAPFSPEEI